MQIDFEKLLENYNNELVTKLRSFNDQHDYLQYWVPDSDKTTSLLNLVDALYETGTLNFSLLILRTDKQLISKLENISKKVGSIKIEEKEKNCKINFSLNKSKYQIYRERKINIKNKRSIKMAIPGAVKELISEKEKYGILPSYEKNLDQHKLKNNNNINKNSEDLFCEFIDNKNKLFIQIDKKKNLILSCWHDFVQTNYRSVMTDKFCDIILNKHIQEAAEHGAIYIEHEIRPQDIKKKITGIILPKKAGGFFFDLDQCIKKIYTKIKKKYNFQDTVNKEYLGLSKEWLKLSYDQKIEKLKQVLSEKIIPALKLNKNDITIDQIEFDSRIFVKISHKLEKINRGEINFMIIVENFFKDNIDKRLELFIIEKKDDNRLRHLNSPQKI